MVNLSQNGHHLRAVVDGPWVPAPLCHCDDSLLMDRDRRASLKVPFVWFLITLAGRCIAMPLVGSILFCKAGSWMRSPIRTGPAVLGAIVESIPPPADHRALALLLDDQSPAKAALVIATSASLAWSFARGCCPLQVTAPSPGALHPVALGCHTAWLGCPDCRLMALTSVPDRGACDGERHADADIEQLDLGCWWLLFW